MTSSNYSLTGLDEAIAGGSRSFEPFDRAGTGADCRDELNGKFLVLLSYTDCEPALRECPDVEVHDEAAEMVEGLGEVLASNGALKVRPESNGAVCSVACVQRVGKDAGLVLVFVPDNLDLVAFGVLPEVAAELKVDHMARWTTEPVRGDGELGGERPGEELVERIEVTTVHGSAR